MESRLFKKGNMYLVPIVFYVGNTCTKNYFSLRPNIILQLLLKRVYTIHGLKMLITT